MFTVLFAYVVFFFWLDLWLGIHVEVDVDRITILTPPPPHVPIYFPTLNSFFNTSDSYQFEISARLKLVSVPFST